MFKKLLFLCFISIVSFSMSAIAANKKGGFVIGVSNSWVGSEWRTQMVDNVLKEAETYKALGLIKNVIVQSTDVNTEGQIDQIRNLMAKGADAILINPSDQRAFNPIIRQAKRKGVIVVATDQELASPDAINVVIDQAEWARTSARWLAKKLNYKGDIVTINGISGHPANEARVKGYREVFAKYPGIKILNEANADWSPAKATTVTENLLGTYPSLKGIWVQDGMAENAIRALFSKRKPHIKITGEARVGYLKLWKEKNMDIIGVANPPGAMVSALRVAMQLLLGKELKSGVLKGEFKNTIYVPIPEVVTNENFDDVYDAYKNKPDYYSVDGFISDIQAASYFK